MPTHRELPIDWPAIHRRRQAEVDAADQRARENRRRQAAGLPPVPPVPRVPPTAAAAAPRPPSRAATPGRPRSRVLDISAGFLLALAVLAVFAVMARDHAHPGYFAAHRGSIGMVLSVLVGIAGLVLYCNRHPSA